MLLLYQKVRDELSIFDGSILSIQAWKQKDYEAKQNFSPNVICFLNRISCPIFQQLDKLCTSTTEMKWFEQVVNNPYFSEELVKLEQLDMWRSISPSNKTSYSNDVSKLLNSITYPIFTSIREAVSLTEYAFIVDRYHQELAEIGTKEVWANMHDKQKYKDLCELLNSITFPIFTSIRETVTLTEYTSIVDKYYQELVEIGTKEVWFNMHDKQKYKDLCKLLNSITFPIFTSIREAVTLTEYTSIVDKYHQELAEIQSKDNWIAKNHSRDNPSLTKTLNRIFHFEVVMKSFCSEANLKCVKQNSENVVQEYRDRFFNLLYLKLKSNRTIKIGNLFSTEIIKDIAKHGIFKNDTVAKRVLGQFFLPNSAIPVPIYQNELKIQYLGLLDKTDFVANQAIANSIVTNLENQLRSFSIFLGPSGGGKTHDILKLASNHFCLFFSGTFQKLISASADSSTSGIFNSSEFTYEFGFRDFSMIRLIKEMRQAIPQLSLDGIAVNFYAEYIVYILILSRILYKEHLNELFLNQVGRNIKPEEFLYFQLNEYSSTADKLFKALLEQNLDPFFVQEEIRKRKNLFIVLDECYVLRNEAVNISARSYQANVVHPVLTPIATALGQFATILLFAGAQTLLETKDITISAISKDLQKREHFNPKFARDYTQVIDWLKDIIDVSGCESVFKDKAVLLKGVRIRTVMNIIKEITKCIEKDSASNTNSTKQEILQNAIDEACSNTIKYIAEQFKKVYYGYKTTDPATAKILEVFVSNFVYSMVLTGEFSMSIDAETTRKLDLVNLSLCFLDRENNKFISHEYLALQAMLEFVKEVGIINIIFHKFAEGVHTSFDSTRRGFCLEDLYCFGLVNLGKNNLSSLVPLDLRSKISTKNMKWMRSSVFYFGFIKRVTDKILLRDGIKNQLCMRLNNISGPDFVYFDKENNFLLTIALKYSKTYISPMEKKKNYRTANFFNMFVADKNAKTKLEEAASAMKIAVKPAVLSNNFAQKLILQRELEIIQYIIKNLNASNTQCCNNCVEIFGDTMQRNNWKMGTQATKDTILQDILKTLVKKEEETKKSIDYFVELEDYMNLQARTINELRLLVHVDKSDSCYVEEKKNIVTATISRSYFYEMFNQEPEDNVFSYFLSFFGYKDSSTKTSKNK